MDYSKYRYENYEGRANVLLEYPLGSTPDSTRVHANVLEVARILFKRAPQNTYVFTGVSQSAVVANFGRFEVWRDNTKLGTVIATHVRGKTGVTVDNQRIRNKRERGGGASTSDMKKAASLVIANFIPASTTENMRLATARAKEVVDDLWNKPRNAAKFQFSRRGEDITERMQSQWPTVGKQIAELGGLSPFHISELETVYTAMAEKLPLHEAGTHGGLCCVHIRGNDYCVTPFGIGATSVPDELIVMSQATLPETLRGKIGMLKLTEIGQYVGGVGVRIDDITYAVFYAIQEGDTNG